MKHGPIEYARVDVKTKNALEAVREELRQEYENKIVELEKRAAFGDKVKEHSSFYVEWLPAKPLNAFKLVDYVYDLDERELGRLQEAFLKEFHSYYLVIQGYVANDSRGRYELWVVKGVSCIMHDPNEKKITNENYTAMRKFIQGFIAARRAYRPKRSRR